VVAKKNSANKTDEAPMAEHGRSCVNEASAGAQTSDNPVAVLRAYAEGRINHVFNGQCPDEVGGHEVRDDDCPVCRAILALQQGETTERIDPFDPEVLYERLRDVAASNYETAMSFGISRDSFERCANDAAKVVQEMTATSVLADAQDAARWRAYAAQFPRISDAFVAVHMVRADQPKFCSNPQEVRISAAMVQSARDAFDKASFPELNKWKKALDAAIQVAVQDDQKRIHVTAAMVRVARDAYHQAPLPEENCWTCALRAAFILRQER